MPGELPCRVVLVLRVGVTSGDAIGKRTERLYCGQGQREKKRAKSFVYFSHFDRIPLRDLEPSHSSLFVQAVLFGSLDREVVPEPFGILFQGRWVDRCVNLRILGSLTRTRKALNPFRLNEAAAETG